MYQKILNYMKEKPEVYAASTASLWDDAYISGQMLRAHLDADVDAASRKHEFIQESAKWIGQSFFTGAGSRLLDLGCGPGLYTELFARYGFQVTGVDFSKRSIEYARKSAEKNQLEIEYIYRDYLNIDYEDTFDVITLIYCDFGVLPPERRKALLALVRKALRKDGVFIVDGFTRRVMERFKEERSVEYQEQGYWRDKPYLCIRNNYLYPDTENYLEQYVVVTEDDCQCYNNWNQVFSVQSLEAELREAGFERIQIYGDVAGKPFTDAGDTICAAAR